MGVPFEGTTTETKVRGTFATIMSEGQKTYSKEVKKSSLKLLKLMCGQLALNQWEEMH